jgi:hypothetical protein
MYQHVASSITSSAVRAPRAEEVSATSAVRGGPKTPTSGEGSDTSTAAGRLTISITWAGSDIGAITTSRLSDGAGGAESSSKTTMMPSPLEPASVGVSKST